MKWMHKCKLPTYANKIMHTSELPDMIQKIKYDWHMPMKSSQNNPSPTNSNNIKPPHKNNKSSIILNPQNILCKFGPSHETNNT